MSNIQERIKYLISILRKADEAYYQKNSPILTNKEYDELYDELKELENSSGIVYDDSPTQNVGSGIVSSLDKKRHEYPMLSLNKTKETQELAKFLGDKEGLLSWKLDGLTIVLTYNDGHLVEALTRGDGTVGEVITNNVKTFKNVPHKINFKGKLIIRGEAVINYDSFTKINDLKLLDEVKAGIIKNIYFKIDDDESVTSNEPNIFSKNLENIILNDTNKLFLKNEEFDISELAYKNPRNLCSGAVRQLDSKITAKRDVRFYAFNVVMAENYDFDNKHRNSFEFLKKLGFDIVDYRVVNSSNVVDAVKIFSDQVSNNKSPSDGLVLLLDDISYGKSLGTTAKYPLDSIAFKWADNVEHTHLIDIEWSASRTGLINPIAIFEPVVLEGTTVQRASLHNLSIFEKFQLGIGDEISVYKANMIIPQIDENFTKSNTCVHPIICPICGRETAIRENNTTKELICPNELCPAKVNKFLENFISKNGMDIVGFGVSKLQIFIDTNFINDYTDIYNLKNRREEIIKKLELTVPIEDRKIENQNHRLGIKMLDNILDAIDASRNTNLAYVLSALNIKNVGRSVAKSIVKYFNNSIERIIASTVEELSNIEGVGDIIAESVCEYFSDVNNIEKIKLLISQLNLEDIRVEENSLIKDKIIVITGSLVTYKDRNALKVILENKGAKVSSSVSKNTDYLVNNDINSNSSKNKKAKELGVKIITEEELNELIGKYEKVDS